MYICILDLLEIISYYPEGLVTINFQHIQVIHYLSYLFFFFYVYLMNLYYIRMMCQLKTKHIAIASSKYYVAIATYVRTYVCTYVRIHTYVHMYILYVLWKKEI